MLSAYVDGELTAEQRAGVETRLKREPALQAALEELRQTVHLLGSMPQLTPPRRFTLTPEMVARSKPSFGYPVLKLASALAVAAFVFVIGVDVFGSTKGSTAFPVNLAQRSVADAPAMEVDSMHDGEMPFAVGESEDVVEEAAEPLAVPAEEVYDSEAAGEPEGLEQTSIPDAELPAADTGDEQEFMAEEPADVEKTYEGADNGSATVTEEMERDSASGAGVAPTATSSLEGEALVDEPEERGTDWSIDQVAPIRLLEIGLAILCIVLISTTLLLRASSR
jgi:hypothetical protein